MYLHSNKKANFRWQLKCCFQSVKNTSLVPLLLILSLNQSLWFPLILQINGNNVTSYLCVNQQNARGI